MLGLFHRKQRAKEKKAELKDEQAELKAALDVSSAQNRNLLVFFLAFLAMIIPQTTDLMLLLPDTFGVVLPIFGVEIPIIGFYIIAPICLFILHWNLLLNFRIQFHKYRNWTNQSGQAPINLQYPFIFNFIKVPSFIFHLIYYWSPLALIILSLERVDLHLNFVVFLVNSIIFILILIMSIKHELMITGKRGFKAAYVSHAPDIFIVFALITSLNLFGFEWGNSSLTNSNINFSLLHEANKEKLNSLGVAKFDLKGKMLVGAIFENSIFCVPLQRKYQADGCYVQMDQDTNFTNGKFKWAQFPKAKFRGGNFQDADLSYANFKGATLEDLNFQGATLNNTKFKGAYFRTIWMDYNNPIVIKILEENYSRTEKESLNEKFYCFNNLSVEQILYQHWIKEDKIKAGNLLGKLSKWKCHASAVKFVESPREWIYKNDRKEREELFMKIAEKLP